MLTSLLDSLRQEYRSHGMTRFAAWVVAYGAALWVVEATTAGGAPLPLWLVFWACVVPSGFYYLFRLVGFIQRRLLWRLVWRLVVTYLFIAVVPILLLLFLVGLGAVLTNGQFAAYLVTLRLREQYENLAQLNRAVVHEAHQAGRASPAKLMDSLETFYASELSHHRASYPDLEITIRAGPQARAFRLEGEPLAQAVTVPEWLVGEEFAGFVMDGPRPALRAMSRARISGAGDLVVILSEPFSSELLDLVGAGIGPVGMIVPAVGPAQGNVVSGLSEESPKPSQSFQSRSVRLPEAAGLFDFAVAGGSTLDPVIWGGGNEQHLSEPVVVYATSRIMNLNRRLLATLGPYSQIYVTALAAVAVLLLVIEIWALVIGTQLTLSMTTTVDRLYEATEKVKAGDFSYRLNLPGRDQLSALGQAFDGMTGSVERLLTESREKTRLEGELEIAREVQVQLFPSKPPEVWGLRLHGVCKPARGVSGDYYDFLRLDESRVGLVLGDVSGKGISAALLMASIQSALHAQLLDGPANAPISTAETVRRLNRQLFESTPLEKYATLFYAVYDSSRRLLTYTNAGHPPPIFFHHGKIERLTTGGTVVGLFLPITYEQGQVQVDPGDLLLAYSDGITEPENHYGEEFGEERLMDVIRRALADSPEALAEEIYRSVDDWTGSPELQDDMTLVVAKATR